MSLQHRTKGEQGETLLELVVAIVILGVCVVAIGSGIAMSVEISNIHRKQAIAQEYLHNYAETLQDGSHYTACPAAPNYAAGLPVPPDGGPWLGFSQKAIAYWSPGAAGSGSGSFVSSCPTPDSGLQEVTLELKSKDGLVDETLVFAVRSTT